MRGLTPITRRRFGQGLGAAIALTEAAGRTRAHAGTHEVAVRIDDFTFMPSKIEILVGDSVTWENGDVAPHTATALDRTWDAGPLERGAHGRVTFTEPGEHRYLCAFHPHMQGSVLVRHRDGG
ncbi:copper-binding protein [Maritimibacter sp. 55A14]|uniref:cupredoxin domain-containing protein n=1 Tax=Maritimibacter sp. 55A14 TaxID=2174844 RepID=UPI000D607034|nr:cupredoxin family copper-binding protein [Maritimibacter sp. 55A14]PWE29891.1 copper-binding protein [Maritimibacter sp. 55A14]